MMPENFDDALDRKILIASRGFQGTLRSRAATCLCMFCALCMVGLSGCAKKQIYVPPEWRTLPPQTDTASVSKPAPKPTPKPKASDTGGAVIKPTPKFKEKDLPATPPAPVVGTPQATPEPQGGAQYSVPSPVSQPAGPIADAAAGKGKAPESAAIGPAPVKRKEAAGPQYHASMHLVSTAKTSLAQGNADHAISLLEQAIQVDVYNGEAFYELARAWRMKGSSKKALEFARKAEVIFQDDREKLKQVLLFESDACKDVGEAEKAKTYRQRAEKL
jgi:hypothetical protein